MTPKTGKNISPDPPEIVGDNITVENPGNDKPAADVDLKKELENTKAEMAELKEQLAQLIALSSPAKDAKEVKKALTLDKNRPFATHRQIGGVHYEQDGRMFDAKGNLKKEDKKK